LEEYEKAKGQAQLQAKLADRRHSLSAMSHARAHYWSGNVNAEQCGQLLNGAVRESSLTKRQDFEVGNWSGQRLQSDLKFYTQVYAREYEPEAVRLVNSQINLARGPARKGSCYDSPGAKGGNASHRFSTNLRQRRKLSDQHGRPFLAGAAQQRPPSQMSDRKGSLAQCAYSNLDLSAQEVSPQKIQKPKGPQKRSESVLPVRPQVDGTPEEGEHASIHDARRAGRAVNQENRSKSVVPPSKLEFVHGSGDDFTEVTFRETK